MTKQENKRKGKQAKMKKQKPMKKSKKKEMSKEEKTLFWIVATIVGILAILFGLYAYTQSQIHFNYKGVQFEAVNEGNSIAPLIFYVTKNTSFLPSNDGTKSPFGFRIRTKPTLLKKIDFIGLDNFTLMRFNAYSFGNNTFNCDGDGVIAMPNLLRTFSKMEMQWIHDENATCDPLGRYNYFNFTYGDKTEIKETSPRCYEVVVKGNDDSCEILPATEKLMVELFVKYGEHFKKRK